MKKLSLLLVLCWICHNASAQWERDYKAGVNAGYEWNIFLNPPTVVGEEEVLRRNDLWVNAFYQGAFFNVDFKRDVINGRFKVGAFLSGANYNSRINANRHAMRLNFSYRTKYADRKYFEIAPEIYRIKRQGINDQDAILTTPFSHLRFTLPVKFDFYLKKKAWLKTEAGYLYKAYDAFRNSQISYHAGFAAGSLSKKWKNNKVETKLTYSTRAEFRFYEDIEQFLEEDEEDGSLFTETDENTRLWTYVRNNLEYSVKPAHERFELRLGLYSTIRLDREEENGYWELAPGMSGKLNFDNWQLSGSLRYVHRNFSDREVGEQEVPLLYQYLRGSLKAEVPVKRNMNFYVQTNLVNRDSSNDRLTRGFREYFNAVVETGLVIRF